MQLSKFTDYSFRILIFLGQNQKELYTIEQLSTFHNLSKDHVKKITQKLAHAGYINSTKGRNGGICLGMSPENINLGDVIQLTEDNLMLVNCFQTNCVCTLKPNCKLKKIIHDSLTSFIETYSRYTLADIL
ncbi:MAG: RrF2 family transcriptional regulator [Turicibacter sp.]